MPGIAPKLPLYFDGIDGYGLTKNLVDTVKQNLKMLILTSPGEKMMDPEYGVGIRDFLFEPNVSPVRSQIVSAVQNQIRIYMPFINLQDILFDTKREEGEEEILKLKIFYDVPGVSSGNVLEILSS